MKDVDVAGSQRISNAGSIGNRPCTRAKGNAGTVERLLDIAMIRLLRVGGDEEDALHRRGFSRPMIRPQRMIQPCTRQ